MRSIRGLGATASKAAVAAVLLSASLAPTSTESAVANGDTRTVTFSNRHTGESGTFTYMVGGVYDQAALDKLNWFLRDWRLDQPTKMDPHLFDIIWEVYRESGSREPIDVLSAYRSPQTNAMLRRRSRQVAEHSQHMEGRAIDAHFVDVGTARIRDIAMRMQSGGVGFYPTGITPWVHIDSGSVRYWPRMSRDALTRLFPDGKTVFIPSDGQPMPGYELAKAEIESRGGEIQVASSGGLFSWLFGARGGGADDAEETGQEAVALIGGGGTGRGGRSGGAGGQVQIAEAGPEAVARAKQDLPTGQAYMSAPPPAPAAAKPAPAPKPEVVAALEEPKVESDASPEPDAKPRGPASALSLAPLPPRRPSDLDQQVLALAGFPLPPVRPPDLSAPDTTGSAGVLPPVRPASLVVASAQTAGAPAKISPGGMHDRLPAAITRGVRIAPTSALALADVAPSADNVVLLARAAELMAPLPPMPIANAGPVADPARQRAASDEVSRLSGFSPVNALKTAAQLTPPGDLRGSQQ